tara:strand:- start:1583 stop:3373 length:1791 start_codon:yes stop_codon:yes gene_type:complete
MRLTFVLLFCVSFVFSQTNDSQLAYQYYQSAEYGKAIEIYKNLSNSSSFSQYYNPFFQCLVLSDNFQDAKKLAQKMIRKNSRSLNYQVDLYMVYIKIEDKKNALKTKDKIHSEISKNLYQVVSVANTFVKYGFYQEALDCYYIVEKFNKERNSHYNIQKAQLYQYLNKDELMIEEYLSYLQNNPSQKITIVNYLQRYLDNNGIDNTSNYNFVKNGLLKYSQNEKESSLFSDLLIWLFMNNNEFNLAYLQAKALDIRLNEDGERLYDLAETFLDNKYFDLAIKCYKYIISKGDNSYYFIDAHINMLFALGQKKEVDLNKIDNLYQKTINKLGENYLTILLLNNYAHFKAFSLNDLDSAQEILERCMKFSNITKADLAECKLVYADVMLLSGNIWTSLLYYSQVEKDFKENPLGHEAKLRRAKISYYQGDFEWAQSQLDILKASTSKLISNDAMDLSLLITDNLNLDTSSVPMQIYARADLLFYQNRFQEAIIVLDSILVNYIGHSLVDEIYFRKFEIYTMLEKKEKSIEMLEFIINHYSFDILYDDALFNLANIYEIKLENIEKASEYYEKILLECSGSIYVAESRKKYRQLRGDNL